MASVKALLFTSKVLSSGEHPIMLRIIKDRKPTYISIGRSCSKDLWDFKGNTPKKRHPFKRELDILISNKVREANKAILNFENEEKYFSGEVIKNKLKRNFSKLTVFQLFDLKTERLTKANRIGYSNVFTDTKRTLRKFRNGKNFLLTDVTVKFLNDFENWFLERGVSSNSISVYMRTLRTIMNLAIKEGYCSPEIYPFKSYNISKLNSETIKRALTKDQVKKIAAVNVKEKSRVFNSKNYFLFSLYNMGMNFIDLAFLKWSDIQSERLYYIRAKSGRAYNVKHLPPSLEILNYYQENRISDDYVFPILNENHSSAKSIHYRIKKVLKQTNSDLKKLAKLAEIDAHLTTYVARHSWATILKRSGVSTSVISEGLGHSTEKTTQIYLDSFENETLDQANRLLL